MVHAILFSLFAAVAAGDAPAADVDAAARAYRIESYNSAREDRDRYQELRDRDDDLRTALSSFDEATLPARQADALAWYAEATLAIHAREELPPAPAWLEEGLAAAKTNSDKKKATAVTKKTGPVPTALPPALAPAKGSEAAVEPVSASNPFGFDPTKAQSGTAAKSEPTPFAFVNSLIEAASGGNSDPASNEAEFKDPVIVPAGPVVDGVDQGPPVELPSLAPNGDSAVEPAVEPAKKASTEPATETKEPMTAKPAEKESSAKPEKPAKKAKAKPATNPAAKPATKPAAKPATEKS